MDAGAGVMHAPLDDMPPPDQGGQMGLTGQTGQTAPGEAPMPPADMAGAAAPSQGAPAQEEPAAPGARYVLYVGPRIGGHEGEMCPGSQRALDIIDPFREDVDVYDVSQLRQNGISLPGWLNGTPCLVDTSQPRPLDPYKGGACLAHLKRHGSRGLQPLDGELSGVGPMGAAPAHEYTTAGQTGDGAHVPRGPATMAVSGRGKIDESALQRMIAERAALARGPGSAGQARAAMPPGGR